MKHKEYKKMMSKIYYNNKEYIKMRKRQLYLSKKKSK
jgi:hypothetical protein